MNYETAQEIRRRYFAREATQAVLAREYGTSQTSIQRIVAGESWAKLRDPSPTTRVLAKLDMAHRIYEAIAHGDDEHRAWLKGALEDFMLGKPVRRP